MSEYASALYIGGQEYAVSMAIEDGMLPPDVITPTEPDAAMALVGYTNVPGISMPEGTQPVRAAGMSAPAAFIAGRREPTIDLTATFGTATEMLTLLSSAVRKTETTAKTHQCMSVLALMLSSAGRCQTGRTKKKVGRFSIMNTMTITAQENQPVTAAFQAWPLFMDLASGLAAPTVTDELIQTAGGTPLGFHHLSLEFGGSLTSGGVYTAPGGFNDYSPLLQSVTLSLNNNLRRVGVRPISHASVNAYLARAAREINVGADDLTITLNMYDEIPADRLYDLGAVSFVLSDSVNSFLFRARANFIQSHGQSATGAEGLPTYSATILSSGLQVTRV